MISNEGLTYAADDAQNDYNKVQNSPHESSLGHEIIAGGASFMAMKEWEDHQRDKGKQDTSFANAFQC